MKFLVIFNFLFLFASISINVGFKETLKQKAGYFILPTIGSLAAAGALHIYQENKREKIQGLNKERKSLDDTLKPIKVKLQNNYDELVIVTKNQNWQKDDAQDILMLKNPILEILKNLSEVLENLIGNLEQTRIKFPPKKQFSDLFVLVESSKKMIEETSLRIPEGRENEITLTIKKNTDNIVRSFGNVLTTMESYKRNINNQLDEAKKDLEATYFNPRVTTTPVYKNLYLWGSAIGMFILSYVIHKAKRFGK